MKRFEIIKQCILRSDIDIDKNGIWNAYISILNEYKQLKDKLHRRNMQIKDLKKYIRDYQQYDKNQL